MCESFQILEPIEIFESLRMGEGEVVHEVSSSYEAELWLARNVAAEVKVKKLKSEYKKTLVKMRSMLVKMSEGDKTIREANRLRSKLQW